MARPTMKDVIEARLKELGSNAFQAAASVGLERNFFNDILNGKKAGFQARSLPKVAAALQLSLDELEDRLSGRTTKVEGVGAFAPQIVPGNELVGARDFPIYAAAEGGDGHLIVTFDPIEVVKRPAILDGVKGAYGLLVSGDSMEPAYDHGDMALVHPGLGPGRLVDVVLYDHPPDGDAQAIIKRMLSWNEREWHLRQFNPGRDFSVARVDWPVCHRVVGRYARR